MKLIHSSDWHLGHQLYNYDRKEEQLCMLQQIESLIKDEQPDALLVSGDIYHTAQPSSIVQRMFTEAIVRMHDVCPDMCIILTAGNHDSGAKHEIYRKPWEAMHVYTLGAIDKDAPEQHIIKVKDKGIVIAVPYVSGRKLPENFYKELLNRAQEENPQGLPIVMMAHTNVQGADWTGHEDARESSVGGIDAMSLSDFGTGYDYLALGHIHRSQWVDGCNGRVRYSGTPLAVSFDETYRHTVSVVEIKEAGAKPELREIEIKNIYPLVTLPLEGAMPWEEVREMLSTFTPELSGTYLRLRVKVDAFLSAGAAVEAQRLAAERECRFCHILTTRISHEQSDERSLTVEELQRESPEEIVRRYAQHKGMIWDDEMSAMFQEIVSLVDEEIHND